MLTIKPVQNLLTQLTRIKHWFHHDGAVKSNQDKLPRKENRTQKPDDARTDRLLKEKQTGQEKQIPDTRAGRSPQQDQSVFLSL